MGHPSTTGPDRLGALAGALLVIAACVSCDEVRVDENPSGPVGADFHEGALRTRVTTFGLGALLEMAHPEGLRVHRRSVKRSAKGERLSIGPLSQHASLDRVEANVQNRRLGLVIETGRTSVDIPVRIEQQVGTRICRFKVVAANWRLESYATNRSGGDWQLEIVGTPNLQPDRLRVRPIGTCPKLLENGSVPASVESLLVDYLEKSIRRGLSSFVDISFYEQLGLLRGRLSLNRISSFPNRRGSVELAGAAPSSGGLALDDNGLRISLDAAVSSSRATCLPPQSTPAPDSAPAAPIDSNRILGAGGELAVALAEPLLARLIRAATLGGFLCRGLDSALEEGPTARPVRVGEANLGTVGLDSAPVQGPYSAAISPGAPPDLTLVPGDNAVELDWDSFSISLYGAFAGTRVRVARVVVDTRLRLRPTAGSGSALPFDVRAITIRDAEVDSPWSLDLPEDDRIRRWTRGLVLVTTEDLFRVPLPLIPDNSTEPAGARVRSGDLLVFLRFSPP